jgi:membrane protease YdiL (CAAX protease family)
MVAFDCAISIFFVFTIFSNIFRCWVLYSESPLSHANHNDIFLNALPVIAILGVSTYILLVLRVFSPESLRRAPQRPNQVSLLELVAALFMVIAAPIACVTFTRNTDILNSSVDVAVALFIMFAVSQRFSDGSRGLGITGPGKWRALGFGLLLYIGVMPWLIIAELVSAFAQKIFIHEKTHTHPVLKQLEHTRSPEQIFWLVIMICVIAPIGEELFFRGLLQTMLIRLIARWRRGDSKAAGVTVGERWAGIIMAAAIFASVHLMVTKDVWSWLPPLFLLGVTLGYAYERTGKLWADIPIHALFNAFAVSLVILGHVGQRPVVRAPLHGVPTVHKIHVVQIMFSTP